MPRSPCGYYIWWDMPSTWTKAPRCSLTWREIPAGYISAADGTKQTSTFFLLVVVVVVVISFNSSRSESNVRGYFAKSSCGANWAGLTKIETTTLSQDARAFLTRDIWPAWRAPIVGTKPTVSPLRNHWERKRRNSAIFEIWWGGGVKDVLAVDSESRLSVAEE